MVNVRRNLALSIGPALGGSDLRIDISIPDTIYPATGSGMLTARGGTGPYTFSYSGVPAGITASASGAITIAASVGTYSFLATVTDSATPTPATYTCTVTLRVIPALTVVAGTPPDGEAPFFPYPLTTSGYQFSVANATGTVTWSMPSGSLPTGVTLSSGGLLSSGGSNISGAGAYNFTARATDGGSGQVLDIPCSIYIHTGIASPLVLFNSVVTVGTPLTIPKSTFMIGGVAPFTADFSAATLPAGLTVSMDISGNLILTTTAPFPRTALAGGVVTDSLGASVTGILAAQRVTSVSQVQPQKAGAAVGSAGIANLNFSAKFNVTNSNGTTTVDLAPEVYGTASGTNTYTAAMTPTQTAYSADNTYIVKFTNGNNGASTINMDGLGAVAIQLNGAALTGGEIKPGAVIELWYDGAAMQIIGAATGGGSVSASPLSIPRLAAAGIFTSWT